MNRPASLAIETSGRASAIALGIDAELRETSPIPRGKRHNLELMPAIQAMFDKHDLKPAELKQLTVSLGPGSFTGLRIAIAAAKMLALTNPNLKLVGVPTIDVLAEQYKDAADYIAVCMNIKRGTMYAGVYKDGKPIIAPDLRSADELINAAPRPLAIVAEVDTTIQPAESITLVPTDTIRADAAVTWRLGEQYASAGRFTAPADLLPEYIREPEAVTLWNELGRE